MSVSPSRIQSTPGSRSGTTVDAVQSAPRPLTAATLSPQSTPQSGNQHSSAQTGGTGAQDQPVPAVPARIQLSDLQNILSRLERMDWFALQVISVLIVFLQCTDQSIHKFNQMFNIYLNLLLVMLLIIIIIRFWPLATDGIVFMSPLRRHKFVCFLAKEGFFSPSSVKMGQTHIVLGWNM